MVRYICYWFIMIEILYLKGFQTTSSINIIWYCCSTSVSIHYLNRKVAPVRQIGQANLHQFLRYQKSVWQICSYHQLGAFLPEDKKKDEFYHSINVVQTSGVWEQHHNLKTPSTWSIGPFKNCCLGVMYSNCHTTPWLSLSLARTSSQQPATQSSYNCTSSPTYLLAFSSPPISYPRPVTPVPANMSLPHQPLLLSVISLVGAIGAAHQKIQNDLTSLGYLRLLRLSS